MAVRILLNYEYRNAWVKSRERIKPHSPPTVVVWYFELLSFDVSTREYNYVGVWRRERGEVLSGVDERASVQRKKIQEANKHATKELRCFYRSFLSPSFCTKIVFLFVKKNVRIVTQRDSILRTCVYTVILIR